MWKKTTVSNIDIDKANDTLACMPQCFVPTGSRVYGGADEQSDYDYIVRPDVTWAAGEVMLGFISIWALYGGPRWSTLYMSTEEQDYSPSGDFVVVKPGVETELEIMYLVGPTGRINFIFPAGMTDFNIWVEATDIMKNLKGEDARRCRESKDARVLGFRMLRKALRMRMCP